MWPAALVPATILFLLTAIFLWLSFAHVLPLVESVLPEAEPLTRSLDEGLWQWLLDALEALLVAVLPWLAASLASLLGLMLALAVTPPLSSPALEHIVAHCERELGIPERSPMGMLREMWCGLKAQLTAAAFAVPILAALWLLDWLVPVLVVVTVPLKCLTVSTAMAWNLFDYPLTLRGARMRERFALINIHWRPTLGFGVAFAALFWIPGFGVLLLPAGVVGATHLVWWILVHDRDVAPRLPRPEPEPASPPALPRGRHPF